MLEYKNVSVITAFICLALCLVLLLFPQLVFSLFNIQDHSSAVFISRRAALLFLGLSVLIWTSKNAVHSESRQAICLGVAVSMLTLSLLGTVEYISANTGLGIFLAVVTELTIGFAYLNYGSTTKVYNTLIINHEMYLRKVK